MAFAPSDRCGLEITSPLQMYRADRHLSERQIGWRYA